jgi:Dolichyl-phosphate-mannose-protein mannosyltransferase
MNQTRNHPAGQSAFLRDHSLPGWESRWDVWLTQHTGRIAAIILAFGFLARVWAAAGTFFNPDEAQHFLAANRASLALAYKSSLTLAHPPLLIFVLYFWRYFGSSEFAIRMSSVLAGILFCWVFFQWIIRILGAKVALLSLIFACLLPPLVSLSAQVRQYSLLLLFTALTGYLFEESLAENSSRLMLLSFFSLYFAMLSHYSALFFTASIGVYGLLRLIRQRFPLRLMVTWTLGQAGALALLIFLYRTHISKLRGSSLQGQATEVWLRRSYFHPGHDHILLFILGRTFGVFQFIFGHLAIGDVMGICFIAGLVFLFKQRTENAESKQAEPAHWQLAILFLLPFVLNCVASLLGVYPFGGTRHSAVLVIFGVASISFALVELLQKTTVGYLTTALIILASCALFGKPHDPYIARADQSRAQMDRSLAFIQERIPHSVPIFVDVQTRLLLGYYLCRQQQGLAEPPPQDFDVLECGGYQLITANLWMLSPETFESYWSRMIRIYDLKPGDTVWVIQEGWSVSLGPQLKATNPEYKNLQIESFGRNIQFFELTVGRAEASSIPGHVPSLRPE